MTLRHTPITRDEQIAGMARMIAGLPTDSDRRVRMGNIERRHGRDTAQAVRSKAWNLIREGYTPRRIETPAARKTDSETSHAAACEVTANNTRHRHQRIVAAAVAANPGCTSRELTRYCELERHEIARRLPELVTAGDVRKGEARVCTLGQRSATTWWPV